MKVLVTGSSGHLGEALVRTLREQGHEAAGVDLLASRYTGTIASIVSRSAMREAMRGMDAVVHAATLHKPHVATHAKQSFVDVNVSGTVTLLEEAVAARVGAFVFTSTTSTFGGALVPPAGAPAAWITEDVLPVPKNIYGVTKVAAESVCELFHRTEGLPILVLRTSRFFPEEDDDVEARRRFGEANSKVNELLHRRVDIADVVDAHLLAIQKARAIGFGRYIISATTPFDEGDLAELRRDPSSVVRRYAPEFEAVYAERGWRMFESIDRVYVNARARRELGWRPRCDFTHAIRRLRAGEDVFSPLTRAVAAKGYHRSA